MVDQDRDMEIIALLSNPDESYTYVDVDKDVIDHNCERTGRQSQIELVEVEYFVESGVKEDKANFCEHCRQVFVHN